MKGLEDVGPGLAPHAVVQLEVELAIEHVEQLGVLQAQQGEKTLRQNSPNFKQKFELFIFSFIVLCKFLTYLVCGKNYNKLHFKNRLLTAVWISATVIEEEQKWH